MGALQNADIPGYSALLLMNTFSDLALPGAAINRARAWPVDGGKSWRFPSGASLTFGYPNNEGDEQRYRTAEFQSVGFDELTRFPQQQYTFLFSRLRRLVGSDVPVRMRGATNPGGKRHEWVKKRLIPDDFRRLRGEAGACPAVAQGQAPVRAGPAGGQRTPRP